ncbi:hypothetical protein EDD36DRAFT_131820 [Exophiala viscosa]|uniref:Uncharacterized protein n=1 Tax=Exophiala viscosa TaxID=2486360 RepID=A0AAN6E147_9EURO|nr:hypothetical protein EDD36DRAFT_131820 [Exophiala viscosa]
MLMLVRIFVLIMNTSPGHQAFLWRVGEWGQITQVTSCPKEKMEQYCQHRQGNQGVELQGESTFGPFMGKEQIACQAEHAAAMSLNEVTAVVLTSYLMKRHPRFSNMLHLFC